MKKTIISASIIALLTPAMASAGFVEGWSGEASLTGSKTTGNTETTDLGLGLKLNKDSGVWRHKFKALVDYGKVGNAKNKQRFALGYQIDRDINEKLYVYGNGDYYQDDFGAFKQGSFIGTGLGYKAIVPGSIGWNLEGGLGYRSQKDQTSVTQNELAVRGFSDFDYKLNDNVSLYNDTEVLYSSSDTNIWNEIGITATLAGNLAARASFRIDTHSSVPLGSEKTDTITRFGVVYTMK